MYVFGLQDIYFPQNSLFPPSPLLKFTRSTLKNVFLTLTKLGSIGRQIRIYYSSLRKNMKFPWFLVIFSLIFPLFLQSLFFLSPFLFFLWFSLSFFTFIVVRLYLGKNIYLGFWLTLIHTILHKTLSSIFVVFSMIKYFPSHFYISLHFTITVVSEVMYTFTLLMIF